jgi:transposase
MVYFVLDVVGELDLSAIEDEIQEKDERGTRPFAPQMMVALLLYGYCVGVFSSRRLEKATYEDVAFRVLAGGEHPHFTKINAFRKRHLAALKGFFVQVLKLCQGAGLVKLGAVALDGTKLQGNASKHKAMSYERMLKSELQLQTEIDGLLSRADQTDTAEDALHGEGKQEEDLPEELRRREPRLVKIREAKTQLEAEAKEARARELREQAARAREGAETHPDPAEQKRAATRAKKKAEQARELAPDKDDDDLDPPRTDGGLPLHEPASTTDGKPSDKAQMNFTDPDSRIMESGGTFLQGYNAQAVVDDAHQIIVAHDLSNLSPDNGNLVPMLVQTTANCGRAPLKALADAGFWTPTAPADCSQMGIDVYISTARRKHGVGQEPLAAMPPAEDLTLRACMARKLQSDEGKQTYARRKAIVEPVFGQIKEARGFRRFLLRGLANVQAEWALVCTGHNLLKLFRFGRLQPA